MNTQLAEKGKQNLLLLAAGGTAVIIGLVWLVDNVTRGDVDELWALAVLPLVLAAITQARRVYIQAGKVSGKVIGWALVGLSTAVLAVAFILGVDAEELWAAFLISIGVGAILAAWR